MLKFGVAKELGYTLNELSKKMTEEELFLWSVYFGVLNEQQELETKRARYRQTVKKLGKRNASSCKCSSQY